MNNKNNYKSRANSTRMILSNISWNNGISNYFKNNIPWQLSTGTHFAERLIRLWLENQKEKNTYYLLELGCGSGMLSYNILNILKKNHPLIYENTTIYITDGNQTQLDNISSSKIFNEHKDHITFKCIDVLQKIPRFNHKFDLIFFTNLIDSLPTHHIIKNDTTLNELVIEDKINPNLRLLDTFSTQLKNLSDTDIEKLIKSNNDYKLSIMGSDIVENIEEKYHSISLEKSKLTKKIQHKIKSFCKTVPKEKNFVFNIQPDFITMIDQLLEKNPQALIIGNDFGASNLTEFNCAYESLLASYGSTSFSTVFLPILDYLLGNKIKTIYTENSFGKIQVFAIGTTSTISKLNKIFKKSFKNFSEKTITDHVSMINELIKNKNSPAEIKKQVDIKQYYLSSFLIAKYLSDEEKADDVIKICKEAIKYYDFMALPFLSLMAVQYLNKKNYKKAKKIFSNICKSYKHLHLPYLGFYEATNNFKEENNIAPLLIALRYAPEKDKQTIIDKINNHKKNK